MGFPKALLRWDEETYLDRQIRVFGAVCADVTVVIRPGAEEALQQCGRLKDVRIIHNPDADRGQLSSLQCGLGALNADSVLFSPVDYAHVAESTVRTVAGGGAGMICQPSFEGQHGHPVWIRRTVIDALLAAPPESAARDVIRRYERTFLAVDDPGCVLDADDPAAFASLRERLR